MALRWCATCGTDSYVAQFACVTVLVHVCDLTCLYVCHTGRHGVHGTALVCVSRPQKSETAGVLQCVLQCVL